MSFELRSELLKIALSGSARFSPYGAELYNDASANLPPAPGAVAPPGPQAMPSTPTPPAARGASSPGFVTERLTADLGGGTHSYSRQTPRSTEVLEAQVSKRKLDLGRVRGIVRQIEKGADTPEGYNRALNVIGFESAGFNPEATGDQGKSIGLGQIYTTAHPETKGMNLRDPYVNLGVARDIVNKQGWGGAYKTTWDRFGYAQRGK